MNNNSNDIPIEKAGKTNISGKNPETKVPKDMGEYVDFETIEEK